MALNFVTVQTNARGGEFCNEIEIKNLQTETTSQNVHSFSLLHMQMSVSVY